MNKLYLVLLFLVGVINFLPIIGMLSIDKINQVYGLTIILAAISMIGYLYFFWSIGNSNAELLKVAQIDIVGLVLLILAILTKYFIK